MKLKYEIKQLEDNPSMCTFQILEQEGLPLANNHIVYEAKNGLIINLFGEPEIEANTKNIWLRGYREDRNNKICYFDACYEYVIREALEEFISTFENIGEN